MKCKSATLTKLELLIFCWVYRDGLSLVQSIMGKITGVKAYRVSDILIRLFGMIWNGAEEIPTRNTFMLLDGILSAASKRLKKCLS